MADVVDTAEIADEVEEECELVVREVVDTMKIGGLEDVEEEGENVINVGNVVEDAMNDVNVNEVDNMIEEEPALNDDIKKEVGDATKEVVDDLKKDGVAEEEVPEEAGGKMSRVKALLKAGADLLKKFSETKTWKYMKTTGKILKIIVELTILTDFVGRMVDQIVMAIEDATKTPPWKGSLTAAQKKQLINLQDAMSTLKPLMDAWQSAIKPLLGNAFLTYGTMTTKVQGQDKTVQVINVINYLIIDSHNELTFARNTVAKGISKLTIFDLNQLSNYIFATFANIKAAIDLRNDKGTLVKNNKLEVFNFPPKNDDKVVEKVLQKDFPKWETKVDYQGNTIARMGASTAIGAFTNSQVILAINDYLQKHFYPVIRQAAKTAGIDAAKSYVDGQRTSIIETAMIPIVGPRKARALGNEIKKKAIEKAQDAAKRAAKKRADELKPQVKAEIKPVVSNLITADKETMKQIAKYAVQQVMNVVKSPI